MSTFKPVPDLTEKMKESVKRLPIILCEDISGSMESKSKIINRELCDFFSIKEREPMVSGRTDIEIIQFNNDVSEPIVSSLDQYCFTPFTANDFFGSTHLWSALSKALDISDKYANNPKYWTPWILLYTDGFPNNESDELMRSVIERLQKYEKEQKIILFILGICDNEKNLDSLNLKLLNSISERGEQVVLCAINQEIDIHKFFEFITRTITGTISGNLGYFIETDDGPKLSSEKFYNLYEEIVKN